MTQVFSPVDDADELLDIVDMDDQVIGTVLRGEMMPVLEAGGNYFRTSEAYMVNDHGRLWAPRRTAHKKIAPNGWDYSVSGHVPSGMGYEAALLKEVQEELNLTLTAADFQLVRIFGPQPGLPPFHRAFYLFRGNDAPPFNPDDFSGYEWLTPQELLAKIEQGAPAKLSIAETLRYLIARPELSA